MECKQAEQLMAADLDGELDASGAAHLRAHFATCERCRASRAGLGALRAAVRREAGGHAAPDGLRARILAALPATPPATPPAALPAAPRRAPPRMPWAWINFGGALALGLTLVATQLPRLGAPAQGDRLEQEVVNSHFRSLMADHLTDVVSSDQHTVKPWFAGKLDYSPPVVDLAAQGFPLVGGRLDYVGGRAVAGLAYRRNKHVINLFVWPDAGPDGALRVDSRQGYQIAHWNAGGFRYEAVSDMSVQDFALFQRLLAAG